MEVFECCINGQEIASGYTEQNDPIAQRNTLTGGARTAESACSSNFKKRKSRRLWIARTGRSALRLMLLGQKSIRDVILFPQLKPK